MLECDKNFSMHDFVLVDQGEVTLLGLPSCISIGLVEAACAISKTLLYPSILMFFKVLAGCPAHML